MMARVRSMIVELEKYLIKLIIDVWILMNVQTLPADQMRSASILWAVFGVPALARLAFNSTNMV